MVVGNLRLAVQWLASCGLQLSLVVAVAQQSRPKAAGSTVAAETTKSGTADGAPSPALAGERRPLYRLRKSDVLEINFTFAPNSIKPSPFSPMALSL